MCNPHLWTRGLGSTFFFCILDIELLLIYFGLRRVFLAVWAFPSCSEQKLLFIMMLGLIAVASRHVGFNSGSMWAQ